MRGHDQTGSLARRCAWRWLILIASSVPGPVRAQGESASEPPTQKTDPIDLAAQQIRTWISGGEQWVVLSGQAAVLQGVDGLRADQVVVKVQATVEQGITSSRVEVYAEGHVRPTGAAGPPLASYRMSQATEAGVVLKPYEKGGLLHVPDPPRGYPILGRAFPRPPNPPSPVPVPAAQPARPPMAPAPAALPPPIEPTTPAPTSRETPEDPAATRAAEVPAAARAPDPAPHEPAGDAASPAAINGSPPSHPAVPAPDPVVLAPIPEPAAAPQDGSAPLPAQLALAPIPAAAPAAQDRRADPPPQPRAEPAAQGAKEPEPEPIATTPPIPIPSLSPDAGDRPAPKHSEATVDPSVVQAQLGEGGFGAEPRDVPPRDLTPDSNPPPVDLPPLEGSPVVPNLTPGREGPAPDLPALPQPAQPPTVLEPLPGAGNPPARPRGGRGGQPAQQPAVVPIMPGSQRRTQIFFRRGNAETLRRTPDGFEVVVIRGGVNLVTKSPQTGIVDISADSAILWRRDPQKGGVATGPEGEQIEDARQPLEVYLEGNVVMRQDKQQVAGNGDQKTVRAKRLYYNLASDRWVSNESEVDVFAPGLIAPMKLKSPQIEQYRPFTRDENGKYTLGLEQIRADRTVLTGSRFPNPGYKITNKSVDMTKVKTEQREPNTGKTVGDPRDPQAPDDESWQVDARQNFFYMGRVPVFYWPRIVADPEDLEAPLRQFSYRYNNYFGHQALTDLNGFKIFGLKKPDWIDTWNIDVDYLSLRGVAGGSEIGWFGKDVLNDLRDPYRRAKGLAPSLAAGSYFGYFDIWGLEDHGIDVLGSGPAIITNNRDVEIKFGKAGFQRGPSGIPGLPNGVPPFQPFRGRFNFRHMQSFLTEDYDPLEDFRLQLEGALISDRHFLEEYYKRLHEVGLDQETLGYLIRQKQNWAWTVWGEVNLQNWYTDTQWLPRLDYYRLGDSLLDNMFTYFTHSGLDYANTHTAVEVNNPFIFAFMPYDPISNTSGPFSAGRFYTNHELDMPLNFSNILRVVPYVQGQAVGWTNQLAGTPVGRYWGAAGARAEIMAWKLYPNAQSELFNVHGLNHKINFTADYRTTHSNVALNSIGVQDDLDDNTYEFVRRYFALTNYAGGLLPPQYDPRFLILRRAISPITGTTDVQASIQTVQLGIHQRLQTKRGPEGRRRIIDWMTLDLETTYFPNAADNFGKPFGQNMYNWQWFVGDRTSLISYGWFEFFDIGGQQIFNTNVFRHNDPFGLNVITSGISIARPPRTNFFVGYTVLDTGPINTSALNTSISYWLSPKWYGTFSTSYDFGNAILLSENVSFTRIGADYIMSIGLNVDPQRGSYTAGFEISPRISPNMRFGSAAGLNQLDTRYAPTQ